MATFKHILHVLATVTPDTWVFVAVVGLPSVVINVFLFYAAFLKLRYCLRSQNVFDGLSGLAILSMASSAAMAFISSGASVFIPAAHTLVNSSHVLMGVGWFGGLITFVVLRPFTSFGQPASAMPDASAEESRSEGKD